MSYAKFHSFCPGDNDFNLTHWGWVTHICDSKLTIIGSDNGLLPGRRQAIIWTNAGILLIGPLGTNFNEILLEIHIISFKKIHLKMSSGKWRPSCLGLNVLTMFNGQHHKSKQVKLRLLHLYVIIQPPPKGKYQINSNNNFIIPLFLCIFLESCISFKELPSFFYEFHTWQHKHRSILWFWWQSPKPVDNRDLHHTHHKATMS